LKKLENEVQNKFKPMLHLFRHRKNGNFIILNSGVEPQMGWLSDTGAMIHISEETMTADGLAIIVRNLEEFKQRKFERGELSSLDRSGKRKFDRIHDELLVTLKSPSELELQPMVPVRGKMGRRGDKKQAILVRLPVSFEAFWGEINVAFSRCGG